MAKNLNIVTKTYRIDSEDEASRLIEEAKKSNQYTLAKYSSVYKERKQKGEVIDAWYRLTLTKVFDDEKEPMNNVEVIYDTEGSAF
jgi:hypothetical protein